MDNLPVVGMELQLEVYQGMPVRACVYTTDYHGNYNSNNYPNTNLT